MGFADKLGVKLKTLVETQLIDDLVHYGISDRNLKFDWSESCIEGHGTHYLDGYVENFSSISVFNIKDELVADGWMEFLHEGDYFVAYWEFLTLISNNGINNEIKQFSGIPAHIISMLPEEIRKTYPTWRYK
ncbi:hypothetical protein ACE5IS_19505 [Leptospira wolffii]|uniref:Uncharacterized protein n=1 Tax=Leptospira wolffii TaxID=409998 RepID=A0ABV5BTP1_9LEPT